MTTKRIKAGGFTVREQFLGAVDAIVRDQADLATLTAGCDQEIIRLKERYAKKSAPIAAAIAANLLLCEKYAEEHRAELYPKNKSSETTLAVHGFRENPSSLATLAKVTWKKVLERLEELNLVDCIRTKAEVDKDAMLKMARKNGHLVIEDREHGSSLEISLARVGVKLVQEEGFFIEPKTDGGSTVKAQEAKVA